MATEFADARIHPFAAPPRRRGRLLWWIAAIGFLLGLAAMFYARPLIERWRSGPAPAVVQSAPQQPVVAGSTLATSAPTIERLAAREAVLDAQFRALEERLAAAGAVARTAAGDASRGEALMLAFAARRAIDRGLGLGFLEPQLSLRFGASEPDAVTTVVLASRDPLTLESLRQALDAIGPQLTVGRVEDGIWRTLRTELANLVVLRRATSPSARPADRLARARRMLDAGQVEAAMEEVRGMPGAAAAKGWTQAAERYVAARRALDALELAAISGRAAAAAGAASPTTPGPAPGA
jgi:hypothetical protein